MKDLIPTLRKDLIPTLRGLNAWTFKQKIKDHTIHRTPTLQLLQKIDVYLPAPTDRDWLRMLSYEPMRHGNLKFKTSETSVSFVKKHCPLVRTTGEMKSHSFVLQFLQYFEAMNAHPYNVIADVVTITDTGNTGRATNANLTSGYYTAMYWAMEAPSGDTTYGILAGTGVTAPANTDYAMETLVAHGSGGGQLQYAPTSLGAAGVVGANVDLVIIRPFINGSGGVITIREIGLAIKSNATNYFLFAHDAVNQAIADGEVALASYVMRTTV